MGFYDYFYPQTWVEGPGSPTPINAAAMQHIEDGVYTAVNESRDEGAMHFLGVWSPSTTYNQGDVVIYDGGLYIAKGEVDSTGPQTSISMGFFPVGAAGIDLPTNMGDLTGAIGVLFSATPVEAPAYIYPTSQAGPSISSGDNVKLAVTAWELTPGEVANGFLIVDNGSGDTSYPAAWVLYVGVGFSGIGTDTYVSADNTISVGPLAADEMVYTMVGGTWASLNGSTLDFPGSGDTWDFVHTAFGDSGSETLYAAVTSRQGADGETVTGAWDVGNQGTIAPIALAATLTTPPAVFPTDSFTKIATIS